MKSIEVDEELYSHIAAQTQRIGESASDILRRMLNFTAGQKTVHVSTSMNVLTVANGVQKPIVPRIGDPLSALDRLLLADKYLKQTKTVNRFLMVLSTLYHLDMKKFAVATESSQGRTRVYFAVDQRRLLQNGRHTKPKLVTTTPYWVITNTSTQRKRSMLQGVMQAMELPMDVIEKVCATL
ncbi:replication initiation negative regulator SeqA [Candidatus Fukatsuia symbiotica]|uniref:Negative modulator of initiation of replication n=1 Tax=Candidatus Fukatsuia symbiotica TaxID=1878942 RepID=A0A2U8I7P9_9GAMM|nr:replication initiation negative regulator SeqA [Candidatus Fukatsuia symbiotica]AWK15201.1 replication initiation regulator SeqA [Candidatus Fukatsuia symbiotica]MEA9444032.1 replication initiation negative regulator SeqA [Candidatus Fukatsuia symbiotica]